MIKKMFVAAACLGAVLGFATRPAAAQTMETAVKVNLPYLTKVGNVSLPPGKYSIREVTSSVIEIKSDARKGPSAFAIVSAVTTPKGANADHTKVTLKQEDNGAYEMKTIWLEGQDTGFELE